MPIEDMESLPEPEVPDPDQAPAVETPEPDAPETPVEEPVDADEVPLTDEEHAEAEAKKKKTGSQREREKRIKAEAELEVLRRQIAQQNQPTQPAQPQISTVQGIPTLDQFLTAYPNATFDDYEGFKIEFAVREAERRIEAREKNRQWEEGVAKVKAEIPDLDEVQDVQALSAAGINLRGVMADSMLSMGPEAGPRVLHHLAKNPEEARRIAGLPPLQAAVELGALKAALVSKAITKPTPPKTTQAPPPLPPARSTGASTPRSYSQFEDF